MKLFMPACICLLVFISHSFGQQGSEPVKVTDLLKVNSISGVTLNRNGTKAAFTVTKIEPDPDNKWDYKYVNHIYYTNSVEPFQLRELTVKESSSQPAWSPDGKQLAFVRLVDSKPQIFILSLDGGEPVQLTHFKYGAGTPAWSPDGKQVLFSSSILLKDLYKDSILNPNHEPPSWPMEIPGLDNTALSFNSKSRINPDGTLDEIRAYLNNNVTDKKAKVVDRMNFQDETGVNPDISFTQFFIQSLQPVSDPVRITHGYYRYNTVDFVPNSEMMLVNAGIDSLQNPDRALETGIFLSDRTGKIIRTVASEKSTIFSNATVSPSGKWIAYLQGPTSFISVPALVIVPLNGSSKDIISIPFDRSKTNLVWSSDEKFLYFSAQANGGVTLNRYELSSSKIEPLTGNDVGIGSFDSKSNRLLFVKTAISDPFELYTADGNLKNQVRITSLNSDWLKEKKLVQPEKHEFKNELGLTVEYWVMKPINFEAGKKYPLLLEIHGGPSAMWGPGETTMWHEFQFFCSKGYGVVYCNPRGSGGYGIDFLKANINDWGKGPTSDVLTALDKTIAEGWADTSRLVVTGGSYAGYLVAWIIAHDHRFKAACSQRGVYDLSTFFGEGNAWRLVPNYFGGYPWESSSKAILDRESPLTYVSSITTPYIIFHGENDRRTGFVASEMLYRSLKVLGKPVEYVRHPGATHEITRSGDNRQRIDQMLRTYEFFERWLATPGH